jgi:hypothetical protein
MMIDPGVKSGNNNVKASRFTLKDKVSSLKMEKRAGKYTSDANNPTKGIFKAPKEEQKEFKKTLKQKIKDTRALI